MITSKTKGKVGYVGNIESIKTHLLYKSFLQHWNFQLSGDSGFGSQNFLNKKYIDLMQSGKKGLQTVLKFKVDLKYKISRDFPDISFR